MPAGVGVETFQIMTQIWQEFADFFPKNGKKFAQELSRFSTLTTVNGLTTG